MKRRPSPLPLLRKAKQYMSAQRMKCSLWTVALLLCLPMLTACSDDDDDSTTPVLPADMQITEVVGGLQNPWGMAFLPDGRLLITERSGGLRILENDGSLSAPLHGVPEVYADFQGGLLDVAIHPDFESEPWVYLSYAEPGSGDLAGTAMGRGTLGSGGLENFEVLFRQEPKVSGGAHFGSRICFHEGYLFLSTGDRNVTSAAQELDSHIGKILRLLPDGSLPTDNPFSDQPDALPEIWTFGNRNVQGLAVDPATGLLWASEHGPAGGDELNKILPGENYGWPLVSWGDEYGGAPIPNPDTQPELKDAALWWTPAIAPAGMDFYTSPALPSLQGKLLLGGLQARGIVVIQVDGNAASEVSRIELDRRVRDVKQGPDGAVYILTDEGNGSLLRLHKDG